MIIFHEGMPGSGKSYAAMKDHIIPLLQKGRKIFARMNGLDYVRVAELAGLSEKECRALLVEIDERQVARLYDVVENDAFVVVDELQNFFPRGRAPLSTEMTKFIAEHRHRGLDILAMGQLLKDCHATWMNRVNRKIQFVNKDVVGKPNEYKWKVFNGTPDDKGNVRFTQVTSGSGTYEDKFFGTYRSFREETQNTERLGDDRVNIWKSPMFRKWLPLLGFLALGALGYLVYLFKGGLAPQAQAQTVHGPKPVQTVTTIQEPGKQPVTIVEGGPVKPELKPEKSDKSEKRGEEWEMPDLVTELTKEHRIRLAGVVRTTKKSVVSLEWRDSSMKVVDSLSGDNLKMLGWAVMLSEDDRMVILARPGYRYIATAWEVPQPVAKASDETQQQIRRESRGMGAAAPEGSDSGGRAARIETPTPAQLSPDRKA